MEECLDGSLARPAAVIVAERGAPYLPAIMMS